VSLANETEDQAQQMRWREWQAAYVRGSRRNGTHAKIVAVVALSLAGMSLVWQLLAI